MRWFGCGSPSRSASSPLPPRAHRNAINTIPSVDRSNQYAVPPNCSQMLSPLHSGGQHTSRGDSAPVCPSRRCISIFDSAHDPLARSSFLSRRTRRITPKLLSCPRPMPLQRMHAMPASTPLLKRRGSVHSASPPPEASQNKIIVPSSSNTPSTPPPIAPKPIGITANHLRVPDPAVGADFCRNEMSTPQKTRAFCCVAVRRRDVPFSTSR
jgi:hypothetical protein